MTLECKLASHISLTLGVRNWAHGYKRLGWSATVELTECCTGGLLQSTMTKVGHWYSKLSSNTAYALPEKPYWNNKLECETCLPDFSFFLAWPHCSPSVATAHRALTISNGMISLSGRQTVGKSAHTDGLPQYFTCLRLHNSPIQTWRTTFCFKMLFISFLTVLLSIDWNFSFFASVTCTSMLSSRNT